MFGRIEITAGKASRRFVPESALTRLGGLEGHLFCKLVAMRTQAKINAPIFIGCVSALVKTVLQKYLQVWKTLVIHPFALLIDRNISSLTAIV